MSIEKVLHEMVYLPYTEGLNGEMFEDYDQEMGISGCLYVTGGIVVTTDLQKQYKQLLKKAAEYFC